MKSITNRNYNNISIEKNAFFNIFRVVFSLLFPIVVFPYVSRILGPENLGSVDFADSVVAYFVTIASMGIPAYGKIVCAKARHSEEELQKTVCELIYISFILELIAFVALIVAIFLIPRLSQYRVLLLLNSITILTSVLRIEWLYYALEQFQYITVRTIIIKTISVLLIFITIRNPEDFIKYACINVFSQAITTILDFYLARDYIHFYKLKDLKISRHLSKIFVFFASAVAITINNNTDIVMINLFGGEFFTGLYTFGLKIKSLLVSVMIAALDVTLPRLSAFHKAGKDQDFRSLLRPVGIFTFVVACGAAAYFIVFSKETSVILGGEQYQGASSIVIALMLSLPVLAINYVLGIGVLQSIGREKQYTKTMIITCFVNIVANYILIPKMYAVGAALATLIAEIGNMLLYYYFGRDYLKDTFVGNRFILIAVASVITGAICFVGKQVLFLGKPLGQMAIFFVAYVIIYSTLVLVISKDARQLAADLIKKSKTRIPFLKR